MPDTPLHVHHWHSFAICLWGVVEPIQDRYCCVCAGRACGELGGVAKPRRQRAVSKYKSKAN